MCIKKIIVPLLAIVLFSACSAPKKIVYFQDLQSGGSEKLTNVSEGIRIRPNDEIYIQVNCKDPVLTDLFNLTKVSTSSGFSQDRLGYTVTKEGNIDFPVLGTTHIAGKTREEAAAHIKQELTSKNLAKDPIVTVEFLNLTFSVMGEVASPGRYNIDKDNITILDALSMAGDLTVYGKRENVLVMREENGMQKAYAINLCSASEVYSSPVYYLQQNDVVYVEPNATKSRQSTVNGNTVRSTSFWVSLASLIVSVTSLLFLR